MKREIKFRGQWTSIGGHLKWVYFDLDEFPNINDEYGYLFNKTQFTGLRDKNGTEIYEGDLVTVPFEEVVPILDDGSGPIENGNLILTVKYNRGNFKFIELENDFVYCSENPVSLTVEQIEDEYCSLEEIEVIGNIYENPELI